MCLRSNKQHLCKYQIQQELIECHQTPRDQKEPLKIVTSQHESQVEAIKIKQTTPL